MNALNEEARARLLDRRRTLLALYQKNRSAEQAANTVDEARFADRATEQEGADVLALLSERERTELGEVDAALNRLASGSWGRCEVCGDAIGRQRLTALPEARTCIRCGASAPTGKSRAHASHS